MDASDDVEQVIDALYASPPAGFTAARDAAAAGLKAAGDKAAAKRVAGLRRPTLAAWASNTLVRADPEEVGQFLQLGQALREAHRALDGEQLRDLSHQQHVVIGALAREAVRLAEEAGTPVSEAVEREVEQILHTVLADPAAAEEWASGRLSKPPPPVTEFPTPTGDAVTRAAGRAGAARGEAGRAGAGEGERDAERRAEARREAERAVAAGEEELRAADEARQRALGRVASADAEVERLERDAARARAAREQAHAELAAAEKHRRAADRAARQARDRLPPAEEDGPTRRRNRTRRQDPQ
ncbi:MULTISPECIES: hypothetical protein [unclassified Streptomyces]|uniref:hypothetical protein n=1 Tax=unclassified Streptomyces TaxID=2593676 RepID=UPI002E2EB61D|nr:MULTISPECIES: hypothetical protein [unclassified Streptomyces]WUC67753.1 hypothetical protein OG861_27970 [Streptomyces sp. NBC_00539]